MRKWGLKLLKFKLYFLGFIGVGMGFLNSFVFSNYYKTDAEIKEHYEALGFSPEFKTVNYNGKTIHYAETGNDTMPAVIFVHGGPGAWYGWMNYMDDDTLRNRFKLIAVDRLGYGKSDYGNAHLNTEEQAGAIMEVIKQLPENQKVILVGRSYGAPIAAMLAKDLGPRVERLMMIAPVETPDKEKFYWFSGIGNSSLVNWMWPKLFNVATAEKYGHSDEMKKILPEWKKITCPTVIMTGANDWVADTSNFHTADTLLKNSSDKKLFWLADAGHFITREKMDLVKQLIIESVDPKYGDRIQSAGKKPAAKGGNAGEF